MMVWSEAWDSASLVIAVCRRSWKRKPARGLLIRLRSLGWQVDLLWMASQGHKSEPMNLQLLTDSILALIHTGLPHGDLDYFNQTWPNYMGLALEDLHGWKWTTAIHPEELQGMLDKWRASLPTGDPLLHESRVRHADGQIVDLGTGSKAANAVRRHDLRPALRSCRAAQKSETCTFASASTFAT